MTWPLTFICYSCSIWSSVMAHTENAELNPVGTAPLLWERLWVPADGRFLGIDTETSLEARPPRRGVASQTLTPNCRSPRSQNTFSTLALDPLSHITVWKRGGEHEGGEGDDQWKKRKKKKVNKQIIVLNFRKNSSCWSRSAGRLGWINKENVNLHPSQPYNVDSELFFLFSNEENWQIWLWPNIKSCQRQLYLCQSIVHVVWIMWFWDLLKTTAFSHKLDVVWDFGVGSLNAFKGMVWAPAHQTLKLGTIRLSNSI